MRNKGRKIAVLIIFVAVGIAVFQLAQKGYRNHITEIVFVAAPVALALGYLCCTAISSFVKSAKHRREEGVVKADLVAEELRDYNARLEGKVGKLKAKLSEANLKLKASAALSSSPQNELHQHIKHLNCLYGLSKLIERPRIPLSQIFEETVNLICNAHQYPDLTCARITFDGIQYETDNFKKTESSQYAQLNVHGKKAGDVEVYYLGDKTQCDEGPFIQEERDLLGAVAEHLGRIASRKQTEDKLRLFRNLIDQSNDCILVIEPKWGRFLDANGRACDSLGYTREELLCMTVKDVDERIPDDFSWAKHIEEVRSKGYIVLEGMHKRKDHGRFPVETNFNFISFGKEDYIIAVTRDITERKQAEENRAKSTNKRVESINQELKDFAYVVSHDLKAPLRGIRTLADWLSTDFADKLDENGKEQMNLLLVRVERMHSLINGVLQYSRVGRVKEEETQVNLNELITDVIDMVAAPENMTITVENELPVLGCEKTAIVQVFQNLLSNAVKYIDKPKGQIQIGCVEETDFWKFSVTDNGPGIEEKHFERIFRIFQTLSPRDELESTGIGLTVVKKILELHGGRVWVESKMGEGTTFFFTLPKSRKEVEDAEVEANIAC
ncbi:MAG: sensor histidine kinase [Planctomycetota bacterium]|jgi:PAS domain S-box-containing protein